jgi:hypothetical protein
MELIFIFVQKAYFNLNNLMKKHYFISEDQITFFKFALDNLILIK